MDPNDTVNISRQEFETLCDDALLLNCLRRCGVDNWDGWDMAIDMYNEENPDE